MVYTHHHAWKNSCITFLLILIGLTSCTKLELQRVELIRTAGPQFLQPTLSYEVQGEIVDKGEIPIKNFGHVWSLSPTPLLQSDNFTEFAFDGTTQDFTSTLSNLAGLETYYIRAYLRNTENEISYSEVITFDTPLDLLLKEVFVEGGSFLMGADSTDSFAASDEFPQSQIDLDDFYIGQFEVTQRLWREFMSFVRGTNAGCDNCPITGVTWDNIQDFLQLLNGRTGKTYRLPTEAEWEYATRGGKASKGFLYSGSNNPDEVGWYSTNSGITTHEVGGKMPNELNIYDMSGNVMEICSDWFQPDYYSDSNRPSSNPKGPEIGTLKLTRGGSYNDLPEFARVSNRVGNNVNNWYTNVGFRLVREP